MFANLLIVLMILAIIGSLGSALFYLVQDRGGSDRTVRALTIRITLSVVLFLLVMLAGALGIITPNSPMF